MFFLERALLVAGLWVFYIMLYLLNLLHALSLWGCCFGHVSLVKDFGLNGTSWLNKSK